MSADPEPLEPDDWVEELTIDPGDLLEELGALLEEIEAMRATYGSDVFLCRGRPMVNVDTGAYL